MIVPIQNMTALEIGEYLWIHGDEFSIEELQEEIEHERSKKKWRISVLIFLERAIRNHIQTNNQPPF